MSAREQCVGNGLVYPSYGGRGQQCVAPVTRRLPHFETKPNELRFLQACHPAPCPLRSPPIMITATPTVTCKGVLPPLPGRSRLSPPLPGALPCPQPTVLPPRPPIRPMTRSHRTLRPRAAPF